MPRFHAVDSFEVDLDRKFFVLAGSVIEGEIRESMYVHIPFNSAVVMTAKIHRIEFALRQGREREDVCLCFEPEEAEIFRGLKIADATFEITAEGSD